MKVCLASFDRVPSAKGASQHILSNARVYGSAGHDVSLITLGDVALAGIRHRPLALAEPNYLRRALMFRGRVERVLARHPFDLVHVRSPWEGLAVPVSTNLVYEVNGLPSIELPYHYPALTSDLSMRQRFRRLELATLDRAQRVLTPSRVTAEYLEDLGVESDRIRVVPNAPSFDEPGLPPQRQGPVRLVYIGTTTSWQGLADVLDLLARVETPFAASIYTPQRKSRWLHKRLSKLALGDRVTVRQAVDRTELGATLQRYDLALAPLTPCERNLVQGCMPIKVLDYALAGLPIVAPDMPVVTDLLPADYPLYRRYSLKSLDDVLQFWMNDTDARHRWGQLGQDFMRERWTHKRQQQALLEAVSPFLSPG